MKKTGIIILITTVLLVALGYLTYSNQDVFKTQNSEELIIPNDAVFYFSSADIELIKTDTSLKYQWISNLKYIDGIVKSIDSIEFLQGKNYLVSYHFISKSKIAPIFYIKGTNTTTEQLIGQNTSTRQYKDLSIFTNEKIHLINFDDVKVISPSPILIESVCKAHEYKEYLQYRSDKAYVNWNLLSQLLSPELFGNEFVFSSIGQTYFTLNGDTPNNNVFNATGNSNDTLGSAQWKKYASLIPMNTVLATSNSKDFIDKLAPPANILIQDNYTTVYVKEQSGIEKILFTESLQINTNNYAKISKSKYKNYELTNVWYEDDKDTTMSIIVKVGNQYIVSKSEQAIYNLLLAVDDENVWGKSLYFFDLLSNLANSAHSNVIINPSYLVSNDSLKSDFLAFQNTISDNSALLSCWINVYESNSKPSYTSVSSNSIINMTAEPGSFDSYNTIAKASSTITTKPYLMRNYKTGSRELLFQTSDLNLNLFNLNGKKLWSTAIGDSITSKITQIDRYKNNKLQYLFATKNGIHLIDRLGRNVEGFPIKLSSPVKFFDVFDYDKKKEYRLMVSDFNGNTQILNMEGNALGIWAPFKFNEVLKSGMKHFKIKDKDCFLSISESGTIHLIKRNGEYYPGFPIASEKTIKRFGLSLTSSFDNSKIQLLSNDNEYFTYNLKGVALEKNVAELYTDLIVDGNMASTNLISQSKLFDMEHKSCGQAHTSLLEYQSLQVYMFNNSDDIYVSSSSTGIKLSTKVGNTIMNLDANSTPVSLLNLEAKKQIKVYYSKGNEVRISTANY